jgi:TolB-like protein/Tfp pilus assembly protein PilF
MSLTRGGFVGTPAFASPEQFDSESIRGALDVRSDIYSLGETLCFALTGKTPFGGRSVEEIRLAQKLGALPIEQLKAAHVPLRLRSLLESMLAVEPAARPGTRDLAARLQRCSTQASGARRNRVALAAAFILILGVSAFFVFRSLRTHPATAGSASNLAAPEKSIAVLPFETLSRDPDSASFADGVQDEILTHLARIGDLKVISRASVMQYKSGVARNLRKVGQQLGVAHVVEGRVQRAGNRVRVNAQLVDTRIDRHLWGRTYDRELADVFAIQSEIAKAIADELHAKLSLSEKTAVEKAPTNDLAAFNLYAHAKTLIHKALLSDASKDLFEAVRLLDEAVKRDPSFFLAYYELAHAHDVLYQIGFDHAPTRLALADAAIQSLRRLRPDAGETHLALATHLYWGYLDYDRARQKVTAAEQALPNNADAFVLAAYIDRRQGRWEKSTRNFERASGLDPRNVVILQQLSLNDENLRRYADMAATLDRALMLAPNDVFLRTQRAGVALSSRGDPKPLHATIQGILAENPNAAPILAGDWLLLALYERDPAAAERALAAMPAGGCYDAAIPFPNTWCQGLGARLRGDQSAARAAFINARKELEQMLRNQPDYAEAICALGVIDAALGNQEDAIREGQRAVELMPVSKNAIEGPLLIKYLALIYAWTGEKDRAIERLDKAAKLPSYLSHGQLRLHPIWDPLRGDPRFDKIVASIAPK